VACAVNGFGTIAASPIGSSSIPCLEAGSAESALGLLRATPDLDVILSDIRMPGIDGIEFLGTVRTEFEDRPWLQVVLVTGHASLETAIAAMRLEASDYLFKPIEPRTLRDSVGHALSRASSLREVRGVQDGAPGSPDARQLHQFADTARALAEGMRRSIESGQGSERYAPGVGTQESELETLRLLQSLQEVRSTIFGDAVMPEPAWEMLAELMRARLSGRHLSVTSLALASRSPVTTALRRIEDLIQGGLALRVPDPKDGRRTHVELTAEGILRMRAFLEGFAGAVLDRP
jgi:CheY-like chemotaxis protein